MSAYKVVTGDIKLTNEALVLQTLEQMGFNVQQDAMCNQRWHWESRKADMVITQDQLPEYLQGFGDLGIILVDGEYAFLGCSEKDSHYMDKSKRDKLQSQGISYEEAKEQQPTGRFQQDQAEFMKAIENGYAIFESVQKVQEVCSSSNFASPTGVDGDSSAWMVEGDISREDYTRISAVAANIRR